MIELPLIGAESLAERLNVIVFGILVLVVLMAGARRYALPPFFYGFLVATGVFFSFDIVVFHWIFGLHRITSGPEANIIEPVLVLVGIGFVVFGLRYGMRRRPATG